MYIRDMREELKNKKLSELAIGSPFELVSEEGEKYMVLQQYKDIDVPFDHILCVNLNTATIHSFESKTMVRPLYAEVTIYDDEED